MIAQKLQESFLFRAQNQTARSVRLKSLRPQPDLLQRLTQTVGAVIQPSLIQPSLRSSPS